MLQIVTILSDAGVFEQLIRCHFHVGYWNRAVVLFSRRPQKVLMLKWTFHFVSHFNLYHHTAWALAPDQQQLWTEWLDNFDKKGMGYRNIFIFPSFLQAQDYQMTLKKGLQDIYGRSLRTNKHYHFRMAHRLAKSVLPYQFAVLEKKQKTDMPVYVMNLASAKMAVKGQLASGKSIKTHINLKVPPEKDLQIGIPLKVRDWIQGESGFIVGALHQSAVSATHMMPFEQNPKKIMAQVTPFNVQFKYGRQGGLIWVSDLAEGHSIANAQISLRLVHNVDYTKQQEAMLEPHYQEILKGRTDADGVYVFEDVSLAERVNTSLDLHVFSSCFVPSEWLLITGANGDREFSLVQSGSSFSSFLLDVALLCLLEWWRKLCYFQKLSWRSNVNNSRSHNRSPIAG